MSEFMTTTSCGRAPTRRALSSFTTSSMVIQGRSERKWPSTPCSDHLSSSSNTYLRTPRGCRPSELPQRYTLRAPVCRHRACSPVFGNRNSSRIPASSSSESISCANASLTTSSPASRARAERPSSGCASVIFCGGRRSAPHARARPAGPGQGGGGPCPVAPRGRWLHLWGLEASGRNDNCANAIILPSADVGAPTPGPGAPPGAGGFAPHRQLPVRRARVGPRLPG